MSKPALFLDRDGVINEDRGYIGRVEDLHFLPGIFDLARAAERMGFVLVIVTNQSGVARGYYTLEDMGRVNAAIETRFAEEDAPVAGTYACPHHPEHGGAAFRMDCDCRKPKPGLLLRAANELSLDLAASVMIGDSARDIEAADRAGVPLTIHLTTDEAPCERAVAHCQDLHAAIPIIGAFAAAKVMEMQPAATGA